MKFFVDAQLPRQLALELTVAGHESVHTLDLPKGNQTSDREITFIALAEERVIITKDEDFVTAFLLCGAPPKLLLISTGNITNNKLIPLISKNLSTLLAALSKHNFVELNVSAITIHA